MRARPRHESSEFLHELERLEHHVGGAVPPAAPELVDEPAVRLLRQALGGHRGTGDISTQAFQAVTVPRRDADVSVQADPSDTRAALSRANLDVLGFDSVAQALDALAAPVSGGHPAPNRSTVERGEKRLFLLERIQLG
jgi:hypothetical protein